LIKTVSIPSRGNALQEVPHVHSVLTGAKPFYVWRQQLKRGGVDLFHALRFAAGTVLDQQLTV